MDELLEKAQKEDWSTLKTLNVLLSKERDNRIDKAREKRLKDAGFPYMATIEKFDFGFQTSVSRKHLLQLTKLSWLESAFNIMFVGPPSHDGHLWLRLYPSHCQADWGLSPVITCAHRAHKEKSAI